MFKFEIGGMIKEYGGFMKNGILLRAAPKIVQGMLVKILKERQTDTKMATGWVLDNTSLWDSFSIEHQEAFRNLFRQVKNVDWITFEWIIDAIKADFPAVASLFLGWRKGNNWLQRQVDIIKEEISK